MAGIELGGVAIVVCRAANDLYAYRDRCASCRSALADGSLVDTVLKCATCGHGFDVRAAGRDIGDERSHLEPLPLLTDDEVVRISVPVATTVAAVNGHADAMPVAHG